MRGKRAKNRKASPDPVYSSELVANLINKIMLDGKKHIASKLVYTAMESVDKAKLKTFDEGDKDKGASPKKLGNLEILESALNNIKPRVEIRSRRIGGANYQVPTPISPDRQAALAMRWLISAARDSRANKEFSMALAKEIELAYNKEGVAVKKREDTEKMAEANKAFAQFA
jgi:small subunit ribosomal protein S7